MGLSHSTVTGFHLCILNTRGGLKGKCISPFPIAITKYLSLGNV
jgi:hypothetical protein